MIFDLIYSEKFLKQIKKLPLDIQKRIVLALERCRIRPYTHFVRLVSNPYYKLRVGDYRVIANIVQNKLVIYILEIGHRKNIYKK